MKNITKHTGLLTNIERLPSSINGNPRYKLTIDGFNCRTMPDDNISYKITNYENRIVIALIGSHYGYPTIDSVRLASYYDRELSWLNPKHKTKLKMVTEFDSIKWIDINKESIKAIRKHLDEMEKSL